MILNLAWIMLLVGFMSFSAVSAQAENLASYGSNNVIETNVLQTLGEQDFDLVNKTGLDFVVVYVSAHNDDKWGADLLGVDRINKGESAELSFDNEKGVTYWDLKIGDEVGNSHELRKVNFKKIKTIELYSKNGEVTSISY